MWVVVTVVAVVVAVATYVTWLAGRVDRLHARVLAASSALDAQSVRRAAAAAEIGDRDGLTDVQSAARLVLGEHPDGREAAENELTRALRVVTGKVDLGGPSGVQEASRRLALARQVHADVVRDALAVRRRPVVRLLRLARGYNPEPGFFDIDDPTLDL